MDYSDTYAKAYELAEKLAPIYGGELLHDPERRRWPVLALHAERVHLHLMNSWEARGKIKISAQPDHREEGWRAGNLPSGNVNPARRVEDIAADIRRRVIDPAKPLLRAYYSGSAAQASREQFTRQRVRQICDALGQEGKHHYQAFLYTGSFTLSNDYDIRDEYPSHGIRAEIRVYNWDALLQICRILRADHELKFPPTNDEENKEAA